MTIGSKAAAEMFMPGASEIWVRLWMYSKLTRSARSCWGELATRSPVVVAAWVWVLRWLGGRTALAGSDHHHCAILGLKLDGLEASRICEGNVRGLFIV